MSAEQRIVTDMEEPVLFLGEGNFSFSIAIAARRGSWKNISATVNHEVKENTAHRQLLAQIDNVIGMNPPPTDVLDRIRAIVSLRKGKPTRVGNVDATNLSAFFDNASEREKFRKNIYFQCPWIHPGSQSVFLKEIITSAANVQIPTNYLYFGLTSHWAYAANYELNGVIEHAKTKGYKLLENDNSITATAIAYGYHHHSDSGNDIHTQLLPWHYTLCLMKEGTEDTENLVSSVSLLVI